MSLQSIGSHNSDGLTTGGSKMKHEGTKILETRRLILRPFTMDDAGAMFKNRASDKEVIHP